MVLFSFSQVVTYLFICFILLIYLLLYFFPIFAIVLCLILCLYNCLKNVIKIVWGKKWNIKECLHCVFFHLTSATLHWQVSIIGYNRQINTSVSAFPVFLKFYNHCSLTYTHSRRLRPGMLGQL